MAGNAHGRAASLTGRSVALFLVLALVGTACGTRVDPDVYEAALAAEATRADAASTTTSTRRATPQPSEATSDDIAVPGGTRTDEVAAATESTDDPGDLATPGRDTPPAPDVGDTPAAAPTGSPAPNARIAALSDATLGDTVTVGMHVPMTGAAPMPTDWTKYMDVLLSYLNEELRPYGRTVRVLVEDDGYNPSQAMAACRRLADGDPLVVIGHTMPAAQDACAGFFDTRDIPYLMRGTTPAVLEGRPLAFFGTTPDDIQGRLLADYVMTALEGATTPVGVLYQNDQVAAKDEFVTRLTELGADVVAVEEGTPQQSDYAATIQKLRAAGAEIVFISAPPVDAIKLSVQSASQGYHPTWLGGGTYWNYNMVLESAGMAMDGAVSFSPWPTIDAPAADEFKEVYARYRPGEEAEDIGLVIWGWMMLLHQAVVEAGPDLSPRSFTQAVAGLEFSRPYWNPVSYPRLGPRGSDAVIVFRADGQAKRWRQVTSFTTGF